MKWIYGISAVKENGGIQKPGVRRQNRIRNDWNPQWWTAEYSISPAA
jgi:hypothetical protein